MNILFSVNKGYLVHLENISIRAVTLKWLIASILQ